MLTKILIGPYSQALSHLKDILPPDCAPPLTLGEDQQTITISQVRRLQQQISLTTGGQLQPVIIHQAQNLSLPAQQALLKTLEEPPPNHLLILTVPSANQLLPTILSRGQLIYLKHPHAPSSHEDSLKLFQTIAQNPPGRLVSLAHQLTQKPTRASLLKALETLRYHLKKQPNSTRGQALQLINQALKDLDNNLNPRLTIEHLFFNLHQLINV